MNTVAIYCRLSKEDEDKEELFDKSESIKNQISMLTTYAEQKGWNVYDIYNDDDYSGADRDRPAFKQIIEDARSGKFNIILAKTQSRFTREIEQVEKYLHTLFPIWNIRFVGMVDNTDTSVKSNKKVRQIYGLTNEWYLEELSDNIRSVFNEKKEKGKHIGSFAPYGYEKEEKNRNHLIIDPVASANVKKIFDLYCRGLSIDNILIELNNENILPPVLYKKSLGYNMPDFNRNGIWTHSVLRAMLHNQVYIGNMVSNYARKSSYKSKKMITLPEEQRIVVENTHEPIISKEQFWKVQDMMKQRRRACVGNEPPHIFAGKVKCMDCGSTLIKKNAKYLRCKLYSQAPNKCTVHSMPIEDLNKIVTYRLRKHINKFANWENLKEELDRDSASQKTNSLEQEKKMLIEELYAKNKAFKQLYEDRAKSIVNEDEFMFLKKELSQDQDKIQNRISQITSKLELAKDENYQSKKIQLIIDRYKDFEELNTQIVQEFIESIAVGEKINGKREIKINWLF